MEKRFGIAKYEKHDVICPLIKSALRVKIVLPNVNHLGEGKVPIGKGTCTRIRLYADIEADQRYLSVPAASKQEVYALIRACLQTSKRGMCYT